MKAALDLRRRGFEVTLLEKSRHLGGKVRKWHCLFPTFTSAAEVLGGLKAEVADSDIEVRLEAEVVSFDNRSVTLATGEKLACGAVVLATGFTLFDARIKEEYGYGIYDNVITSADLEEMFRNGRVALRNGERPRRVAFLHCVGSRDEKVCQRHCS